MKYQQQYSNLNPVSRLFGIVAVAAMFCSTHANADIIFAAKPMGPASNIYAVDASGRLDQLTADTRWRDLMADTTNDGSVVFVSDRNSDSGFVLNKKAVSLDLYLRDGNNGTLRRLTETKEAEYFPQFSPDGKRIAFIARREKKQYDLVLMDRYGKNSQVLASAEDVMDFSWSPEGKRIAYTTRDGEKSELKVVGLPWDERPPRSRTLLQYQTTAEPKEHHQEGAACHSDVRGFEQVVSAVEWSPDGQKIAYITSSLVRQERVLRVLNITNNEDKQISQREAQVQQPVTWSEDSEQLLYSALVDYNFYFDEKEKRKVYEGAMQIFLADLIGENRQLTKGEHLHNRPVLSPDGKSVAYLYGEYLDSPALSIRVMDLKGNTRNEIYSGVTRDSFLHWTPSPVPAVAAKQNL